MYDNLISLSKNRSPECKEEQKIKLQAYYNSIHHDCSGRVFIDKGYYYRHNGEIYTCKEEEINRANFRLLECTLCHKEFMLFNNGVNGWDNVFVLPNVSKIHHFILKG